MIINVYVREPFIFHRYSSNFVLFFVLEKKFALSFAITLSEQEAIVLRALQKVSLAAITTTEKTSIKNNKYCVMISIKNRNVPK